MHRLQNFQQCKVALSEGPASRCVATPIPFALRMSPASIEPMQAVLFCPTPYGAPVSAKGWPVPATDYAIEVAEESMAFTLEQATLADELGFDWVSVAEHHYAPMSLTPNPMVMAGALLGRVKRAKIALLGSNIPIQNPVRVAEELAMLDTLSKGRIVAGMLRGTSNEYVTYGVNPAESRERFVEALQLILRCWSEPQPFGWIGRYYEYRTISIWPRPVQAPHPPIFMSISSPEMAELAARYRINAGFAVTSVPLAKASVELYRQAARREGYEVGPDQVLYRVPVHLATSDEEAFADLETTSVRRAGTLSASNEVVDEAAARAGYYGRDEARQRGRVHAAGDLNERVAEGRILLGSPKLVLDQVRTIRDELGAGILEIVPASPTKDKAWRTLELFGTKVLPAMRAL
jgi:alkanesulfonate monooxygenase SsuD/methylene tetrahydromethanopterin reductase-like flavin-dependent oxidoreductase (luciferase family)